MDNNEQGHTPGNFAGVLLVAEGRHLNAPDWPWLADCLMPGGFGAVGHPGCEAHAARLAAAWNAFEGITTAQIEALGAGGVAELVAALRDAEFCLRDNHFYMLADRLSELLARIEGGRE